MASMSYCAVENTASDMSTVLGTMEDFPNTQEWFLDRSEYEQRNVKRLRQQCQQFLDATESLTL